MNRDFFLLKPEQQISTLLRVLRRRQEPALVVLDQFEELLDPETNTGLEGRGDIALFLEMLLQDLGVSRVLLTCSRSPYDPQYQQESRVRSFLISRMSLPEGVALLQQRGIQGTYEELSLIWQRCAGHVFSLILFNALARLSGFALSYLLNSPDYQSMWSSEVAHHLLAAVYRLLNPIQHTLVRILSLFREPVPTRGVFMTIVGEDPTATLPPFERELQLLVQLALVQQLYNQENEPCYCLHPPRNTTYRPKNAAIRRILNSYWQPSAISAWVGTGRRLAIWFYPKASTKVWCSGAPGIPSLASTRACCHLTVY